MTVPMVSPDIKKPWHSTSRLVMGKKLEQVEDHKRIKAELEYMRKEIEDQRHKLVKFSNIKRPTKEGVFVEERVVNVPVRNQVHYFNGDATVGPPDLYTQIKCSFCNLSTYDSVFLLCDLCDSAAYTSCVRSHGDKCLSLPAKMDSRCLGLHEV
ncbi:zinc finger, FYVE/PHD-type containing protein [Tanacetum coccineum]